MLFDLLQEKRLTAEIMKTARGGALVGVRPARREIYFLFPQHTGEDRFTYQLQLPQRMKDRVRLFLLLLYR